MRVLVTGSAGFIGCQVSRRLLESGHSVAGIDNFNDYYDVALKRSRISRIENHANYTHYDIDLEDRDGVAKIFDTYRPTHVINLAAQAGVRYSLENPHSYIDTNVVGFTNILEGCRAVEVEHLVFASSSSVYGTNDQMPFSVQAPVNHPISMYAATKRANELMAHTYSHLFKLPSTGLRFFTVYGPWGRPDMALFMFTKAIIEGLPIDVFNEGQMKRSFTYVDDIVEGVICVLDYIPEVTVNGSEGDPSSSATAPFKIFNIGNDRPETLLRYIEVLENCIGKKADKNMLPMQPGDVPATWADVNDLREAVNYEPKTPIEIGIKNFVEWYKDYYKVD